jgi:radical SAM superfamily enzyme YgiQ (UPF0313 family)
MAPGMTYQPPLGILYLAGGVRERFKDRVEVDFEDLRLTQPSIEDFVKKVRAKQYDLVGFSAMSPEAKPSHLYARAIKEHVPETLTALGGPHVPGSLDSILEAKDFDWVFNGESDASFPAAVGAHFFDQGELDGIPGLSWRTGLGREYHVSSTMDLIEDLETLPMPAWDLVPFDEYSKRNNMNNWQKGYRYAPLFTSRGCPYKCSYCHQIFGKKVRWRSMESCMREIEYLNSKFGVDEFKIIDDIFNMKKQRMHEFANKIVERYGERKMKFCFPNGLRADILNREDLEHLYKMGTYQITIAVETVTPRLQKMIQKNLSVERAENTINMCDEVGISTKSFFMIGFPTESVEEIKDTIRFAARSKLVLATFFIAVPQEGTGLYEFAREHGPEALEKLQANRDWEYHGDQSWYQLTYGVNLLRLQKLAYLNFYLRPSRLLRIWKHVSIQQIMQGMRIFLDRSAPKSNNSPVHTSCNLEKV